MQRVIIIIIIIIFMFPVEIHVFYWRVQNTQFTSHPNWRYSHLYKSKLNREANVHSTCTQQINTNM